ncbi:DNA repair protein RecN [Alkalicoccobacillus murimartini]|uniref:DNA repair protein RecN n=1 Tax=Alkalicoccobacillus murimartini TaxID=171685 RepID=A0ABT9YM58_9BACI|nr:DNA repair protein RecN [Alkalicoccobacillus murimartini]MDQ0208953.1 DNA repair protein RecN (Recombination protein N) [Alkalicoccobacillus murimartini]
MLIELSVRHFAIIEELTVPFDKGLTVLTGETGAGKSIIIDAIGLLLGGRGSAEFVRHGESRAEIEGLFAINKTHHAVLKASELGIQVEDELILRREITSQGKSICRINGKLVTLGILREIGQSLVDIHGQHEHQSLMQPDKHLGFLDSYASKELKSTLHEYQHLYETAQKISTQIRSLSENEQETAQRIDLLRYQLDEIEKAELKPNEDDELDLDRNRLANSEKLYTLLRESYERLYGDGRGLDIINESAANLETASELDQDLKSLHETVNSSYFIMEEAAFSIREKMEQIEFDPDKLELIENRLAEIQQLKRKYGSTVEEILEYASRIEEELDSKLNKDDRLQVLNQKLEAVLLDLEVEAEALTKIRTQAAEKLTESIHEQLRALYMEKTIFQIDFKNRSSIEKKGLAAFSSKGVDHVEFFISTNPGEPLKPLAKVASGGEISRIMLAIKSIFSAHQGVTSVIFDEVDTGVSGRVAQAIAEKIYTIASGSQVLCITHLPQVAAMADQHLYISKQESKERVSTSVTGLVEKSKIEELARMISGVEVTELTRKHAHELLDLASQHKQA